MNVTKWPTYASFTSTRCNLSCPRASLGADTDSLDSPLLHEGADRNIEDFAQTREEYQRAVSDRRFIMQRLTYRSDGLEVYAYLYRPRRHPIGGEKLPVVVFNRGNYTREDFSPEVLMPGRRLAQEGYLVVAPMLRGRTVRVAVPGSSRPVK